MSFSPSVSVIVPSYNAERFIRRCVDSVLSQTFADFELIVIDNYSQDSTLSILNDYSDSRIRIFQVQNNGVIAVSRNLGITNAEGEFVAFLDADDYWVPEKLEHVMAVFIGNSKVDIVCHNLIIKRSDAGDRKVKLGMYNTYHDLFVHGNCLSTSAVVMKRKKAVSVNGFDESSNLCLVEDYDFWLMLFRSGCDIVYLDEFLSYYCVHDSNSSAKLTIFSSSYLSLLKKHLYIEKHTKRLILRRYVKYCRDVIVAYLKVNDYIGALRQICVLPIKIIRETIIA